MCEREGEGVSTEMFQQYSCFLSEAICSLFFHYVFVCLCVCSYTTMCARAYCDWLSLWFS